MRKYKNLYQHNGKWYTKENRVAKVGEKVLIVDACKTSPYKNGDVLSIIKASYPLRLLVSYGNNPGEFLYDREYVVLVPSLYKQDLTATGCDDMYQTHNFVIQERGAGKKAFIEQLQKARDEAELKARFNSQPQQMIYEPAQPVPFSKEYYTAPVQHDININAPEQLTQAKYDKMKEQLMQEADKMDAKYGGTYRSVYVAAIEHTLAELEKRIVPEKRKWTDAEITEAKRYVADKMYSLTKYGEFIRFYGNPEKANETIAVLYRAQAPSVLQAKDDCFDIRTLCLKKAMAKCCPTDTFSDEVGKMVATKKLFNEELPAWLQGEKK